MAYFLKIIHVQCIFFIILLKDFNKEDGLFNYTYVCTYPSNNATDEALVDDDKIFFEFKLNNFIKFSTCLFFLNY